jgi:hypothetical protein
MPIIFGHLIDSPFPPGSLGERLESLGWFFEEIPEVVFPNIHAARDVLNEQVRHLRHTLKTPNASKLQRPVNPSHVTIDFSIYWARESDFVLWSHPHSIWEDRAILFDSYNEFVYWTQLRLHAHLESTRDDLIQLGLVLGSLRRQ